MAPWYRFMIEAKCSDEWFNIDHWCRRADGTIEHEFLLAASERDLFSCDYDELAHIKSRLYFHELAATTREIIQAESPSFSVEAFESFDYFLWGDLEDLEKLLEKEIEDPYDTPINRAQLQRAVEVAREELRWFRHSIPYEISKLLAPDYKVENRIIIDYG